MIHSGGGLIMVFTWVNNLFIQQDCPLDVGPHKSMVNGCCQKTCSGGGGGVSGSGVVVVVVSVRVDTHEFSVDKLECSVDMLG